MSEGLRPPHPRRTHGRSLLASAHEATDGWPLCGHPSLGVDWHDKRRPFSVRHRVYRPDPRLSGMASKKAPPSGPLHLQGTVLPSGKALDLYVVDGRITFAQPTGALTVKKGGWILPGLVDAHAHLALASPAGHAPTHEGVRASAHAQLQAGVLLLREPGSIDHESKSVGPHEGLPRILTAGRFLAPPDGYFPGLAREVTAKDLPAAAAEEAKASGAWVKVIGDYPQSDGVMHPHWDLQTLRAT